MMYLEEQAEIQQQNQDNTNHKPNKPDLIADNVSTSGEFVLTFNIDLAGPTLVKMLENSLKSTGKV